jgi:hypothetical protein
VWHRKQYLSLLSSGGKNRGQTTISPKLGSDPGSDEKSMYQDAQLRFFRSAQGGGWAAASIQGQFGCTAP